MFPQKVSPNAFYTCAPLTLFFSCSKITFVTVEFHSYSLIIDHIVPDIPQQPLIIPSQHSSTIKLFVEVKVEVKTNAILKELLPLKNSNISLKILHIYPFVHKYNEKS